MTRGKTPHRKHVPLRTCIACRQVRGKRDLMRVVRTPDRGIQIDPGGKMAGRGAYLCRSRVCWEQALKSHRLGPALKTTLTDEDLARLREFAATLPAVQAGVSDETELSSRSDMGG